MSAARACSACVYFDTRGNGEGLCRRWVPRLGSGEYIDAVWPVVQGTDWCGFHATEWPAAPGEAAQEAARRWMCGVLEMSGMLGGGGEA